VLEFECLSTFQVHRIHSYSFGRQQLVGRLFSMFRLWSITKYSGAFVNAMEDIIRNEAIRHCCPPPPEEAALTESFKKALADVDNEYLSRLARKSKTGKAPKQSKYRVAILEYLSLFNGPLCTTVTHYCWDAEKRRPCCRSWSEMAGKLCDANSKLFQQRRPETPTQKEWTRIRLACCWCLMGMTRSRLLLRGVKMAVLHLRASDRPAEMRVLAAHEAGAGDQDLVHINASRLDSTLVFLENESTGPLLCCIVLTSQPTGTLLYHLLGSFGNQPSAKEMLGLRETRVGKMAEALLTLLNSWSQLGESNVWSMLLCWAPDYQDNDRMLRLARHQGFAQYAGVYWRFLLYYSDDIFPLHVFLDPDATESDKNKVLDSTFAMDFRCCLGWGVRQIAIAVESEAGLRSQLGLGVLRVLFRLIRFGISKVERLHSLHRHWCQHQGGGNRSIVHLSCRHQVFEQWVAFREQNPQQAADIDRLLVDESQVINEVEQALRPEAPPSKRSGIGGNPKFTMRNSRLQAAKQLKGGEKLTQDEIDEITRECLEEYEEMRNRPDEYGVLFENFRQEHAERADKRLQVQAAQTADGVDADLPGGLLDVAPIWQHGHVSPHWPTDLSYLQDQLEECSNHLHKCSGVREYYEERPYHILPGDTTGGGPRASPVDLRGCSRKPPFICMDRNRNLRQDIEAAMAAINGLVRRVGRERAEAVSVFLRCHGQGPRSHSLQGLNFSTCLEERSPLVHFMLCLPFYQPFVQVYAVARTVGDHVGADLVPAFPYMVRVCEGPSLVSRFFQSAVFTHTGQLAQYMARTFSLWSITLLQERPVTLMDWEVLGTAEEPIVVDFERIATSKACRKSSILKEMASLPVRHRVRTKSKDFIPNQ